MPASLLELGGDACYTAGMSLIAPPPLQAAPHVAEQLADEALAYERFWQEFVARGKVCDHRRDWHEWVGERGPLALLIARVPPRSRLAARIARLQRLVGGRPHPVSGLELHPRRFLHITVQSLGFLSRGTVPGPGEIEPGLLRGAATSLGSFLAHIAAFPVIVGGANSFFSSLFLEVYHAGRLSLLRRAVRDALPWVRAVDPWEDHAFHLTLGYYGPGADHGHVLRSVAPWRTVRVGTLRITELELVTVETDGREPYPPLVRMARFPLASRDGPHVGKTMHQ